MLAMMGAMLVAPIADHRASSISAPPKRRHGSASEYAAHKAELAALEAGQWPEGDCERAHRRARRAARPRADGASIRDYWRTLAWLVVEAEEAMIEEVGGDVAFDRAKVPPRFADLDRLRGELGQARPSRR